MAHSDSALPWGLLLSSDFFFLPFHSFHLYRFPSPAIPHLFLSQIKIPQKCSCSLQCCFLPASCRRIIYFSFCSAWMVSSAGIYQFFSVTDRHRSPGRVQGSSGGRAAKLGLALHCPQANNPTKVGFLVLGSSLDEQSNSAPGAGEGAAGSEPEATLPLQGALQGLCSHQTLLSAALTFPLLEQLWCPWCLWMCHPSNVQGFYCPASHTFELVGHRTGWDFNASGIFL